MDGFLSITHLLTLATVYHVAYSTISADGWKVPQITLGRACRLRLPIEALGISVGRFRPLLRREAL